MRIATLFCEVTMNWYRQNSGIPLRGTSLRGRRRLIGATVLVLAVLAVDALSHGAARAAVRAVGSAAWREGVSIADAVWGSGFLSSRRALEAENASLSDQLARREGQVAAYQVLKDENAGLRAVLHLAESERGITAPVISSFRASPYGTFLVGAGSADAVAPGDLVLTGDDFVIGHVTDVSEHSSLVGQVFGAGSATDALIRGVGVSVEGQGGGNARAVVPREVAVAAGDPVIAPQFNRRAIGLVGDVQGDPASAYKNVYIHLPVNLSALDFVYLVKR